MIKYFSAITFILALSGCNTLLAPTATESTHKGELANQQVTEVEANDIEASEQLAAELEAEVISNESMLDEVAEVDNLWWMIRDEFTLAIPERRRLQSQRNWYAKHPSYIQRMSERASPYLFHIYSQLKQRKMPMELALLPIVESAFDPFAYSHGRASGMWQFIPGTGKRFGLKQNWWYDGRRDVYHSTIAALDYLEYLHRRFDGDWLHAIAAYNSGEGNVSRAIRKNKKRNKPTDFWSLDLPRETEAYVPKLLALADLLKRAEHFQLSWTPIQNAPYFAKVTVDSQIDLVVAAELAQIEMDDFYTLNPGFNHWATEPKKHSDILVPLENATLFSEALSKTPKEQRIAFKRYVIKSGDSLLSLSKKFNTTVELLRSTNGIRGNMIRAGQALLIPTASYKSGSYVKSSKNRLTAKQNRKRSGQKVNVYVKKGDSFWSLSREYKVGMRQLAGWNNMAPTDPLRIGQKLVVWTETAQAASTGGIKNKTRKIRYRVRSGDSIARIAGKFRVKVADVVRWNRINPKKYLQPGQRLTLYVDITRQY
ncbi:LysM peptidoglycan-binding domain-containing protein [Pleionea mediterranea]|uniref:Membrane-bound lytic murein transglycosylase D n=1 Tax=Pleionea mediterranea TaxID=523701 RepID=A0A316G440_9GAMM|nr:LysM peptidoglycan-binding domain-containing protein [Pleionea mediterranea]PWK54550.1 membrane-bound lytic murein transglycosylase D [Pleionea mediterranea]